MARFGFRGTGVADGTPHPDYPGCLWVSAANNYVCSDGYTVDGEIPTVDGGILGVVTVRDTGPAAAASWIDKLAQQLGVATSTLEVAGLGIIALVAIAVVSHK